MRHIYAARLRDAYSSPATQAMVQLLVDMAEVDGVFTTRVTLLTHAHRACNAQTSASRLRVRYAAKSG